MKKEYITVPEAARIFRLKPITLYKWVRGNKVTFVKPGRSYLLTEEWVQTYLDTLEIQAEPVRAGE